jgi:hypothetical protein
MTDNINIISLGFSCYISWLLRDCSIRNESLPFDWMNSFYFHKLVESFFHNFNIFDTIMYSPFESDKDTKNVFYNPMYHLRLPHEAESSEELQTNLTTIKEKYTRRFDRFKTYIKDNDKILFIRQINTDGRYGSQPETIEMYNSGIKSFDKYIKTVNPQSQYLLVLISENYISDVEKSSLCSQHTIVIDNIIPPEQYYYPHNKIFNFDNKYLLSLYLQFFKQLESGYANNYIDVNIIKQPINKEFIVTYNIGLKWNTTLPNTLCEDIQTTHQQY